MKIEPYKLVKIIFNAFSLLKIILNMVIQYHDLLNSIISNQGSIFTMKF